MREGGAAKQDPPGILRSRDWLSNTYLQIKYWERGSMMEGKRERKSDKGILLSNTVHFSNQEKQRLQLPIHHRWTGTKWNGGQCTTPQSKLLSAVPHDSRPTYSVPLPGGKRRKCTERKNGCKSSFLDSLSPPFFTCCFLFPVASLHDPIHLNFGPGHPQSVVPLARSPASWL